MSGAWRSIDLDSTPEAICSYAKVFRRVRVLLSIHTPRRGWSRACPPRPRKGRNRITTRHSGPRAGIHPLPSSHLYTKERSSAINGGS